MESARAVARTLIGGGGCLFIYSCFARQISFQIDEFEFDLKRNLSRSSDGPGVSISHDMQYSMFYVSICCKRDI